MAVVAISLLTLLSAVPVAAVNGLPRMITATSPVDGATDVPVGATLLVTFSEPVHVSGDWFKVECAASSNHLSAASGGPLTWSINPINDFAAGESCALTIRATDVTDQDESQPMAEDVVVGFTTAAPPDEPPPSLDVTFLRPFKAMPAVNEAKAGSSIPIVFSVDGGSVPEAFDATSAAYTCGTTPPATAAQAVVMRAVAQNDTYALLWKTSKSWEDTCRVFVLQAEGGGTQVIAFRFK